MANTSLHGKTIRPGSLSGYSYYYSNRQAPRVANKAISQKRARQLPSWALKVGITAAVIAALIGVPMLLGGNSSDVSSAKTSTGQSTKKAPAAAPAPAAAGQTAAESKPNPCAGNTAPKFIKISVSQRHLWACEGDKAVHDTPVITGMLKYPETLTPPGNYQVYAKQQDTRLTGSDSAGNWNYPVSYWMPFLDNEHGTYGFHDATWRPNTDFGNTDPNGDTASHGCIELPLAAMDWLYKWTPPKTPLTVES